MSSFLRVAKKQIRKAKTAEEKEKKDIYSIASIASIWQKGGMKICQISNARHATR